jgi:hypothetical protein
VGADEKPRPFTGQGQHPWAARLDAKVFDRLRDKLQFAPSASWASVSEFRHVHGDFVLRMVDEQQKRRKYQFSMAEWIKKAKAIFSTGCRMAGLNEEALIVPPIP